MDSDTTFTALVTTCVGAHFAVVAWQQGVARNGPEAELYTPLEPMTWLTPSHRLEGVVDPAGAPT